MIFSQYRTCILIGILSLSLFFFNAYASEDYANISASDQKKLDKASKLEQQALDKNKEADELFAKSATVSTSSDASEVEKINNKALGKQIEGLKLTDKAQRIIYDVYKNKLVGYISGYTGSPSDINYLKSQEETAQQNYQAALGQIDESSVYKDNLILFSRLSTAIDLEKSAVAEMKKAFESINNKPQSSQLTTETKPQTIDSSNLSSVPPTIAATGIPAPAIVPTPAPSTKLTQDTSKGNIYKAVHVNEDMVDMFNKFLTEQHPNDYQNYLFDFNSLDFSDVESIRNSWYKYIYGSDYMASSGTDTSINKLASDSLQLLAKADSLRADSIAMSITKARKDSLTLAQQSKSKGIKGKSKKGKKAKEVSAPSVTSAELMASAPSTNRKRTKPTTGSTESYKFKARQFDTIEIITKGFTYQVQIAACRSQLSKSYLNAIYKGPEIPIETFENNWYKYSVGSFLSYRSAKKFRDNCSVNGAFVVAFCNGRKININDALIARKSIDKIPTAIIDNKIPLQFRIQIAASKTELTVAEVRYIYDSVENIEMIMENEWYKYSLPSGTDYQDARHIVKNINVKGAFVTAYSYGNKISLHEAFKMMQSK